MEAFYSIQGEGFNSGKAAYFIRIGGCDVCCMWCDVQESWNAKLHPLISTDEIIKKAVLSEAKSIVVTGGEPFTYKLDYLCEKLKENNFQTFVETSGSQPLSGKWDWICLSPKKNSSPLDEYYKYANELKVVICETSDFEWAEKNAEKVNKNCILYLQPEWSKRKTVTPLIVDYILKNPKWKVSIQIHKYMNIP